VIAWLRRYEAALAVDPVILGEVRYGILLLPRGKRRARLERWFEEVVKKIQCIAWEADTGLRWAELLARLRATGRPMPVKDSFIAATALANRLTVATRNVEDFEKAGCLVIDPFEA
jgi:predicted nucleic acid-binding protein